MATQAQIAANRRNAQSSTGPRTDAGKAAVRQNALRHGYCSGMALMHEESEKEFAELQEILREENQPVGANEEILVHMMAVHFHNFGRANVAVCDALEAAERNEQSVPPLPLALRYQQAACRQFKQDLSQLRKLQKERRLEEIGFVSQETPEGAAAPAETASEAPKREPLIANPPVAPPIAVPPVANRVETGVKSAVQTPPKAA